MNISTPARVKARDRRLAAIHEAGHYLLAKHFGVRVASVWICPSDTAAPGLEKTFIGHTQFVSLVKLSRIRRAMVAVAGAAAEAVWRARMTGEPDDWFGLLDSMGDPNALSPTDWEVAGCSEGEPDRRMCRAVEQAWALFDGQLWPELCAVSRLLIRGDYQALAEPVWLP